MINFIICDDNEFFLMEIYNVVSNFCLNKGINFEIHVFKSYNNEFFNIMKKRIR